MLAIIIGRPGSGKTTFSQLCISELKKQNSQISCIHIDSFKLLLEKIDSLKSNEIKWLKNGQFEISERAVIDKIICELYNRAKDIISNFNIIFIEFSSTNYNESIDNLISLSKNRYIIIYLETSISICLKRNNDRLLTLPLNSVPENVIKKYYSMQDLSYLKEKHRNNIHIVENNFVSIENLKREVESICKYCLKGESHE